MRKLIIVVPLFAFLSACASITAKKDVAVVTHAFETCAGSDARAAVGEVAALLPAVLAIVAGGAIAWEADLDALALKVGDDAVTCAIDAIEAMLAPPAAAGSGAKVSATLSPTIGRLEAYRAKLAARHTAATK